MKKRFLFVSLMVILFCSLNAVLLTIFQESQSPTSSLQSKEKRTSEVMNYTPRPSGETKTTEEHEVFFVEQKEYELGDFIEGKLVEGEAAIINSSNDDYRILDVQTSCGCTSAKILSPLIHSGSRLTLPFSIRTDGESGILTAQFQVNYKNENTDEIGQLFFSAKTNILTPGKISVEPAFVDFGKQKPASIVKQNVLMRLADGIEEQQSIPSIIEVNSPDWIDVSVKPISLSSAGQYEGILELTCTTPNSSGTLSETIRLVTNNQRYPVLTIPVSVDVAGNLFLEPQRIIKVLSADAFPLMFEIDLHIMKLGTFAGYAFRGLDGLTFQCKYTVDSPMKLKLLFEKEDTGNGKKRKVYKGEFIARAEINDEIHEVVLPILIIADESGK